jgi:hypothetical protein
MLTPSCRYVRSAGAFAVPLLAAGRLLTHLDFVLYQVTAAKSAVPERRTEGWNGLLKISELALSRFSESGVEF